jgi:NitT/TauT family transport system substrate-binding protein
VKRFFCVIGTLVALGIVAVILIINHNNKSDNLTKIKLAEVAHSIFYAPQYVALENGYFEDEGLDIELILTPGADKVMAAVLSNDVQIGFSGSEATIYVYNGGEKDYVKTFAQLTQKDGSFIVSRKKISNFKLEDLKGKYIIGGRKGGMPEMTFEWTLRENNINPANDLKIDTSVAFPAMSGAFIGGLGDFVTLFEPTAVAVERQGFGYVVASVGELGGIVPYTAYNARKSYIEDNPEIIESFTRAIYKGLQYVDSHSSQDIANVIYSYFPDTSMNDIIAVLNRYKGINAWSKTPVLSESGFNHLQEIMQAAGELKTTVDFDDLVNTEIAKKVVSE